MHRFGSLSSVALACVFMIGGGLPGVAPHTQTAPITIMSMTELQSGENGHYYVKADINGSSIEVLVDTGASAVALSYEDAMSVGLRPGTLKYDVPVSTANGVTKAARVKLRKVEIDTVRVADVDAFVMPEGALNGTLLGMSFLGRLDSFKVEDGHLILKN
jgi:aspartyl protease family protein